MELQFHTMDCPYLQRLKRELQTQEQTQELRLPDGMPDIGRVIGAWGQPLVRTKEWRSGGMGISGGVMVWVLYEPEEGGAPQSVEAWLPFQCKWELPDTARDGTIHGDCLLKSVDARSTSARKLMLRSSIGIMGQAFLPGQAQIAQPDQLPEDIQLLKRSYPVCLPVEAGERHFELDEEFELPHGTQPMEKLVYYRLQPEVAEQKVMAGKVVFRGNAKLHMLYQTQDGNLCSVDQDFPYSMYSDLDREHSDDATAQLCPMITGLELEINGDGKLHMKAGLAGQFVIYDRQMLQIVEDAYSTNRMVTPRMEKLQLPILLDSFEQPLHAEQAVDVTCRQVLDTVFNPDQPRVLPNDGAVDLEFPGQFQMLYFDENGMLQCTAPRWEEKWAVPAGEDASLEINIQPSGRAQGVISGSGAVVNGEMTVYTNTVGDQGIPMVTGLELGEAMESDPNRPSLLLRRFGNETLWEMAKETGTTVEAIQKANHLQAEPDMNQVLLIPIP